MLTSSDLLPNKNLSLVNSTIGCTQHLFVCQEQYGFAAKMRNQAVEQLKALETWVERQATGLDMAANPESLRQSFDKLLKVLSPLIPSLQSKVLLFVGSPPFLYPSPPTPAIEHSII